ncbi:capsule biosynthesis protein [Sporolactobacillus sp. THM7-7]|nr:capsule biosynthesis protein [Sporolactobacillus sp. THM7-7]
MEETISLKEIVQTLRKRLSLIAIITLLTVAAGAFVTYFLMTPKYDASTQILVNQSNSKNANLYNTNAVQTNVQLVNTYSDIIKSPAVLNPVVKKLNLNMTSEELAGLLSVGTAQNSQVFSLTAETDSPSESVRIVNGVSAAFQSQVQKVMNVDNVTVLSKASVAASNDPVKPKPVINIAIALVVGLMVSIGIAFLLEYLDNTIKTEEDIEQVLGLPVLGAVAQIKESGGKTARMPAHTPTHHRVRGGNRVEAK